jgi:hypothetical protein
MKVTVYKQQLSSTGDFENFPIKGATVELYKTEYDRQNGQNLVISHTTDSSGLAEFYGLQDEYYYIRASHPSYGVALDETKTRMAV